jgi:hypothetical protein
MREELSNLTLRLDAGEHEGIDSSCLPEIWKRFRTQLSSVLDYRKFIKEKMER